MILERNAEMGVTPGDKTPPAQETSQGEDKRWTNVLEEVIDERETGRPWWFNFGISLAWAAGIALGAALVATLVLAIVELFKEGRQFTLRTLSDYIFWASALLLLVGFLSPASANLEGITGKKSKDVARPDAQEGRGARMMRQRMRRIYDPWRWRLWGAALFCFGLSALVGLASMP
jgi:hypothetical protein